MASSFQVKNNGKTAITIAPSIEPLEVKVLPGQTSPAFTGPGEYIIRSVFEHLPLPDPEIVVTFTPGEQIEAKAINKPSLNIEIIAKFDFSSA